MMKTRISVLGSAVAGIIGAAMLCGASAKAQDYDGPRSYDRPAYSDPAYERPAARGYDRYEEADETVIVRPYYDEVQKRQLVGRINGEVNPVELSISKPVNFSDLDLSRDDDYSQLHERVADTARDLCAELDARYPDLRERSGDRECVRNATRNAMRSVIARND